MPSSAARLYEGTERAWACALKVLQSFAKLGSYVL